MYTFPDVEIPGPHRDELVKQERSALALRGGSAAPTITTGAPDIGSLYNQLATTQGKPIDYSGIEEVNRGRIASARRDALAGMALSQFYGKSAAPMGQHVFKQALEDSQPLRPNLADVGYVNPETGDFTENPMVARSRDEKFIAGRIDSLVKQKEWEVQTLLAQGKIDEAKVSHDQLQWYREQELKLRQAGLGIKADAAATKAAKANDPKFVAGMQGIHQGEAVPVYRVGDQYTTASGAPLDMPPLNSAEAAKQTTALKEGEMHYRTSKDLLARVQKDPSTFGFLPGVVEGNVPPGTIKSWIKTAQLSPAQIQLRAEIAQQASERIHALFGSAQSAGETSRFQQFEPNGTDMPEDIMAKLRGAVRLYETFQRERQSLTHGTYDPHSVQQGPPGSAKTPMRKAPPGAVQRLP